MLLLSRKVGQSISLPELDVDVEVTGIRGRSVTVGVTAPPHVKILRSELKARNFDDSDISPDRPATLDTHESREQLHIASLALYGLQYQIKSGQMPEADLVMTAIEQLEALQSSLAERRAAAAQKHFALLVEDDPHECNLLAGYLRQVGFNVQTAGSSETALDFLRKSSVKPDIMLLDLNMSVGHHEEVMRCVRSMPESTRMKLYGVCCQPPVCDAEAVGLSRCFLKPIQPDELVREIKRDLAA
ncbi:MAG: response regulator [Aureliella sp.]